MIIQMDSTMDKDHDGVALDPSPAPKALLEKIDSP